MEEVKHERCTKCKCWRLPEEFLNEKGRKLKTCFKCRDLNNKSKYKNRCEHNREKSRCKDCGGSGICEHNRIKSTCKDCGGGGICEHNRQKSTCKDCGGSSICEHDRRKSQCKDCGGGSICEHNREKAKCKDCGGGSICEHNRIKSRCKDCGGGSICEHNKQKSTCKDCDPSGHLRHIVSCRIKKALTSNKSKHSIEYLGCNIEDFKEHIESQFVEGMTWENHGEWHIDHIVPIKYKEDGEVPTLEDTIERLHWRNTQPLWASENIAKGNRFIG
jgi:hypothetical protein